MNIITEKIYCTQSKGPEIGKICMYYPADSRRSPKGVIYTISLPTTTRPPTTTPIPTTTRPPTTTTPIPTTPFIPTPSAAEISSLKSKIDLFFNTIKNNNLTELDNYKTTKPIEDIPIPDNIYDKEITTRDVYEKDINTILLRQNTLYIIGTIACSTLLITTIANI